MIRKKPVTPEAAKLKMAALCARSEYCEYEIREKLWRMGISRYAADEIIGFLVENRFIDNLRFAKGFANDKTRFAGWGRRKTRQALALKRISSAHISEALENIDETEYEAALKRVAESKAKGLDLTSYDDRTKLYRYLLSRGYESDMAARLISTMRRNRE